jgi:hypothetical protein
MDVGHDGSLRGIGEALEETWQRRLDRAASRPLAHEACLVAQGKIDPVRDYEGVVATAEFLWDTEDDLLLVAALLETWGRQVQRFTQGWEVPDLLQPRFRALLLRARLAFRADEYERAGFWADAAVKQLRAVCGGEVALRQIAVGSKPTIAGELYCAFLAIRLPVMRMNRSNWPTTKQLHDLYVQDALAVIRHLPAYDRLPALVTQTFFAIAARGDDNDASVVGSLADLDLMLRPRTRRAQCTRLLVDMALAGHRGDVEAERATATEAERELLQAGLHRHIRALNSRGWWRLQSAA